MSAKDMMGGGFSAGQAKAVGGNYVTIAATGSVIGDAAAVTATNCVVTSADGTKGVALSGEIGDEFLLFNNAASTLKVYPESGNFISVSGTGLGTASAAVSLATQKSGLYKKITSTQWISVLSA